MYANYQSDFYKHIGRERNQALCTFTNISGSIKECSLDTKFDFDILKSVI